MRVTLGTSATDEMHDDGDDGEDEQQMDEKSADMEEGKATKPEHDQNYSENKKHVEPSFVDVMPNRSNFN